MRRALVLLSISLVCLAFTVCKPRHGCKDSRNSAQRSRPARDPKISQLFPRVVEVFDGDTILVQTDQGSKEKVRYLGVDAPERGTPFYSAATNFNRHLVQGKNVVLDVDNDHQRDKYGRLLGSVLCEDPEKTRGGGHTAVSLDLVRMGLARVYLKGKSALEYSMSKDLISCQRDAIDAKRGIWSDERNRLGPGGKNTRVEATKFRFHSRDCPHFPGLKTTTMLRLEALLSGRSPCRSCNP